MDESPENFVAEVKRSYIYVKKRGVFLEEPEK